MAVFVGAVIITVAIIWRFVYKYFLRTYSTKELEAALVDAVSAMEETGIPYNLASGSALGIVRDGHLINDDNDIDIEVNYDHLPKKNDGTVDADGLLNSMHKHGLSPSTYPRRLCPAGWQCDGRFFPIMYQFRHRETNVPVDVYIVFVHGGKVWCYQDGGEYTGKGYWYPIVDMDTVTTSAGQTVQVWPQEWLALQYGNWQIPRPGFTGREPTAVPNDTECILPPPI